MRTSESRGQADLFAPAEQKEKLFGYTWPDDIQEARRPYVLAMLRKVQDATVFPWKDLTVACCEEMRFNGMARLFPPAEGRALLQAYAREVRRVYALIEEPWMPLYEAVFMKLYDDAA